ncbi:MAG: polyprenyl synthetase family protein [Polyangiales bacterium]
MMTAARVEPIASGTALCRLSSICQAQGRGDLAEALMALSDWARLDFDALQERFAHIAAGDAAVQHGAQHLLSAGGKRMRPLCVLMAARAIGEVTPAAGELAVAIELVHSATLLHDDVVDLGEERRGVPTARMCFGNTVSIFAGDWLLTEALRRVLAAKVEQTLPRLLDVIETMILAESAQLQARGRLDVSEAHYFRVVEGKTASLFAWALYAGARAAGANADVAEQLEGYGHKLGIAFQLIDDWLDYAGDRSTTGKAPFADLREGKLTYPLLLALDAEPALRRDVEAAAAEGWQDSNAVQALGARLRPTLEARQIGTRTQALAAEYAAAAVAALPTQALDEGAQQAFAVMADAVVRRAL